MGVMDLWGRRQVQVALAPLVPHHGGSIWKEALPGPWELGICSNVIKDSSVEGIRTEEGFGDHFFSS